MPDLNNSELSKNYRRASPSSTFGTRELAFYAVYLPKPEGYERGSATRVTTTSDPVVTYDSTITGVGLANIDWANDADVVFDGNEDDDSYEVSLPFTVSFLGSTYDTIYVGSNSYVTFGGGADIYEVARLIKGLLGTDDGGFNDPFMGVIDRVPGLMISAGDNSVQKIYSYVDGEEGTRTFRIRFEGFAGYDGVFGGYELGEEVLSGNMRWELVMYEATPTVLDVVIERDGRNSDGVTGVTDGTKFVDDTTNHRIPFDAYDTELWTSTNSLYARAVQALQQVVELYYIGNPAVGGSYPNETFRFVIGVSLDRRPIILPDEDSYNSAEVDFSGGQGLFSLPFDLWNALDNAGLGDFMGGTWVQRMVVGPTSIYVPVGGP